MQVEGLSLQVIRWGNVNWKTILYCFYKIFFNNIRANKKWDNRVCIRTFKHTYRAISGSAYYLNYFINPLLGEIISPFLQFIDSWHPALYVCMYVCMTFIVKTGSKLNCQNGRHSRYFLTGDHCIRRPLNQKMVRKRLVRKYFFYNNMHSRELHFKLHFPIPRFWRDSKLWIQRAVTGRFLKV